MAEGDPLASPGGLDDSPAWSTRLFDVVFGLAALGIASMAAAAGSPVLGLAVVALVALLGMQVAWRRKHRRIHHALALEVKRRAAAEGIHAEQARELRVRTRELAAANCELEAASQLKNDFVSIVSHELRTPITSIRGLASTMAHNWDRLDDEHRRDFVERIQRQARRQERLVDDLLTLSRINAGELGTRAEVLAPRDVVCEVVDDVGMVVDVDIADDLRVLVDRDHLYRMVANLLTNAAKYGAPPFRVQAEPGRKGVELRVIDHGDGVPPDFVGHLFDEFSQASSEDAAGGKGVGLGLSIVRNLAEANGGRAFHRPVHPHGFSMVVVLREAGTEQQDGSSDRADEARRTHRGPGAPTVAGPTIVEGERLLA